MLRLLHAIHDFLPRHRAGSEIYAYELCRRLASRHHVTVLCAECDPGRPHGSVTWRDLDGLTVVELVNNWAFGSFDETYRSPFLNDRLRHVLAATRPEVLHVHNLLNLSMDLPALARARGVPSAATLHDYTLVCPSGGQRVHVADAHVCETIDVERCARCFPDSPFHARMAVSRLARRRGLPLVGRAAGLVRHRLPGLFRRLASAARRVPGPPIGAARIAARLDYARRVYDTVDLFAAPSAALAAEFAALGLPRDKLRVSDYGMPPFPARPRPPRGSRLIIGFVGTLVWHKGAHVLVEAVRRLPPDRVAVTLCGDPSVFPAYVRSLETAARGLPIEFAGSFENAHAPDVYAGFDLLVVPSLWPENSPLVIHEAFQAGVPVVASRQGGIPGLVTDGVNGLLYDAFDAGALAAALGRLLEEPGLLDRLAAGRPPVKSIEDDARWWEERYTELRAARRPGGGRAPTS